MWVFDLVFSRFIQSNADYWIFTTWDKQETLWFLGKIFRELLLWWIPDIYYSSISFFDSYLWFFFISMLLIYICDTFLRDVVYVEFWWLLNYFLLALLPFWPLLALFLLWLSRKVTLTWKVFFAFMIPIIPSLFVNITTSISNALTFETNFFVVCLIYSFIFVYWLVKKISKI